MSPEVWTFLGVLVTALTAVLVAYWQHGRKQKEAADATAVPAEPVAAPDWARDYVTSLLTQIETLSSRRDELHQERDELMEVHMDLRIEFERFRAESRGQIESLRREFEVYRQLSESKVRTLEREVARLEAENHQLHSEIAELRGVGRE